MNNNQKTSSSQYSSQGNTAKKEQKWMPLEKETSSEEGKSGKSSGSSSQSNGSQSAKRS